MKFTAASRFSGSGLAGCFLGILLLFQTELPSVAYDSRAMSAALRTPARGSLPSLPGFARRAQSDPGDSGGEGGDAWTILVYGHGDHNLSPGLIFDLLEMEAVGSGPDFNIVVQADFNASAEIPGLAAELKKGVTRFRVEKSSNPNAITSPPVQRLPELNMDDPKVLADFVTWGVQNYPADHYAVIFWDHGGQWIGFGGDTQDGTAEGSPMGTAQIRAALDSALAEVGVPKLDFLAFDTCLMGGVECLPDMAGLTDLYIACPEIDYGLGWDYTATFRYLRDHPAATPAEFGKAETQAWRAHHLTPDGEVDRLLAAHAAYDLTQYEAFLDAFDAFAAEVETLVAVEPAAVAKARAGTTQYGLSGLADLGKPTDYIDLGEFAGRLAAEPAATASLKAAATALVDGIDALVIAKVLGEKKTEGHGLSVYYPSDYAADQAKYEALTISTRPTAAWPKVLAALARYRKSDTSVPQPSGTVAGQVATVAAPASFSIAAGDTNDVASVQTSIVQQRTTDQGPQVVYLGQLGNVRWPGGASAGLNWDSRLPVLFAATDGPSALLGGFFEEPGSDLVISYASYTPPGASEGFTVGLMTRVLPDELRLMSAVDASSGELAPENIDLEPGGTLSVLYFAEVRKGDDPNAWTTEDVRGTEVITIPEGGIDGLHVALRPVPPGAYSCEFQIYDFNDNQSGVLAFPVTVPGAATGVRLSVTIIDGGRLRLAWPEVAGVILQATSGLGGAGWSDVPEVGATTVGGVRSLELAATEAARFFRLIQR